MKKYFTLIIVLFCVGFSFAQSKRKKNGHLTLELMNRQDSYDSLKYVYYVETYEFEKGIKKNYQELMLAFPRQEEEIVNLESAIAENQAKLTKLKEPFSSLKEVQLPNYSFTGDQKKELRSYNPVYEELDKENIPDDKLKVQNEFLERRIRAFDSVFVLNEKTIRTLRFCKDELGSLCATLSEQLDIYKEYNAYLEVKNEKLVTRLDQLKENYLSKKRIGFSREYHEVFPEWTTESVERPAAPEIHSFVTEDAGFPGGNEGLKYYLGTHFLVPQIAIELGIQGTGWVRFIIREDGSIAEIKMAKGFRDCPECDREAIRVIKMMPKWRPARMDGRAVKSMFQIPIEIKLN